MKKNNNYTINVGNLSDKETQAYVNNIMTTLNITRSQITLVR